MSDPIEALNNTLNTVVRRLERELEMTKQLAETERLLRAENERLRKLLHDIAVARRGNDSRVDEAWDELPEEIEDMWAALAEADDRPWLCPNCGHPAARHFIGACPEYERPAT